MSAVPPRLTFRQYDEDLDEWVDRVTGETDHYGCRFCPATAAAPGTVEHSPACPANE